MNFKIDSLYFDQDLKKDETQHTAVEHIWFWNNKIYETNPKIWPRKYNRITWIWQLEC